MKLSTSYPFVSLLLLLVIFSSCGNKNKKVNLDENPILLKNDKPKSKKDSTLTSAPIINISDNIAIPLNIISIKDSASSSIRLSQKLGKIYGSQLKAYMQKNKLKAVGPPMAWYKSQKAPFFFEAGIPVDKKPLKMQKGILFKRTNKTKIIIAHFYGPYTETTQAYQALKDWIKDEKKTALAPAYEIYVGDPIDKDGIAVDPYKVQTDIVIPYY